MKKLKWMSKDVFNNTEFPLGVRFAYPQPPEDIHTHDRFSELVIIHKGSASHITGDEKYTIQAGDCFVITGNRAHGYGDLNDLYLVNVLFDHAHILDRVPHIQKLPAYHVLFCLEPRFRRQHCFESRLHLGPEELSHVLSLVDLLKKELDIRNPGFEFMAVSIFMQIVGFLCRSYGHKGDMPTASLMKMGKVLGYLQSHYRNPIHLEDLVALSGMTQRTFMRVFNEATGLSPIDYLIRLRVAKAGELLTITNQSVTEVAFRVGFEDSNYFTRQFKRIVGTSPSAYRTRLQQPIRPVTHTPNV